MIRFFGMTLCFLGLTLAVLAVQAAQDAGKVAAKEPEPILKKKPKKDSDPDLKKDQAIDPKDKKDPAKDKKAPKEPELKKIEPDDLPAIANREKREDIIARIDKNLKATAEDLKKAADDPTRKKQRDIVKDLEDLINQQDDDNKKGGGGGGGGNGNAGNQGGGAQGGGNQGGGGRANRGGRGGRGGGQANAGNQGAGAQDKKDPKVGQNPKDQNAGKDPKNGGNQVGGGKPPPDNNLKPKNAADMKMDYWGDLPRKQRLEMDAYSQDRFMNRYESVIRQYFTTIGERKGGEKK